MLFACAASTCNGPISESHKILLATRQPERTCRDDCILADQQDDAHFECIVHPSQAWGLNLIGGSTAGRKVARKREHRTLRLGSGVKRDLDWDLLRGR